LNSVELLLTLLLVSNLCFQIQLELLHPGSRAPIKVPGPGSPLVTNVFGRGLGANGTPIFGLEHGNLRHLAVDLDEMTRRQDRRERARDEREARLIGNEAIEALRLSAVGLALFTTLLCSQNTN
jgi:hypothetical protein